MFCHQVMFFKKFVILSAKVKVTNQVTLSHLILSVGSLSPHPYPLHPPLLRPASPLGFVLEGGHSHGWKVASRPSAAERTGGRGCPDDEDPQVAPWASRYAAGTTGTPGETARGVPWSTGHAKDEAAELDKSSRPCCIPPWPGNLGFCLICKMLCRYIDRVLWADEMLHVQ